MRSEELLYPINNSSRLGDSVEFQPRHPGVFLESLSRVIAHTQPSCSCGTASVFQFLIFRLRFLEQRQFSIRLLPQRQKVLVRPSRRRLVAAHRLGTSQLQDGKSASYETGKVPPVTHFYEKPTFQPSGRCDDPHELFKYPFTPKDRQAPPRHRQGRANGGPEPSSSVLHHLI